MNDSDRRVSTTLSHAIATFSPYELYMLGLSLFSIGVLAVDSFRALPEPMHDLLGYVDAFLCVLFLADFLRALKQAPDRGRYMLRSGWLDLISSVPTFGVLRLGRMARIARIVRLLRAVRSVRTIGRTIAKHREQSALLAATLVSILLVVFASIAVLQFEQDPESNISSAGDALWWAFATITTVGYGDRYPVTLEGRLTAAVLMAAGVALFGTLSGLVASWFLHGDAVAEAEEGQALSALTAEVAQLRGVVERLAGRA